MTDKSSILCPLAENTAQALKKSGGLLSTAEQIAVVGMVQMFCHHLIDLSPSIRAEFVRRYGSEAWSVVVDQWDSLTVI